MSIYTPTASTLAPYDCPDDGDDVTANSVNIALHHLGDAIKSLTPTTTREVSPDDVRMESGLLSASPAFASLGTLTFVSTTHVENSHTTLGTIVVKTVSTMADARVFYIPLGDLSSYNGYTLTSAVLRVIGKAGHGGLPALMPRVAVVRRGSSATTGLLSTSWALDTSGSTGAYETEHDLTFTADQNNVIDTSQYTYALLLQNEGNTNATNGLQVRRITLSLTAPV